MIQSLSLGELWGVPAVIELVDKEKLLLERVQTDPHYHNEMLEFNFEGAILGINQVEDRVIGDVQDQYEYERSKFGIRLDHKNGIITRVYDEQSAETVKHRIKTAYNDDAEGFLELLKNTKVTENQKPLKNKMLGLLKIASNHNFTQYVLYKIV